MTELNIKLLQKDNIPPEVITAAGDDPVAAGILCGRGYDTAEKIRDFFLNDYNPVQTMDIPCIDRAVERITKAVEAQERICVYGDYDVDGVTSTAILMESLKELGADCIYHVPDRFSEGYGMSSDVIRELAGEGIGLIITCDCGISNVKEVALAAELGIDTIVTDHHSIPEETPSAYCIINPKLWGREHKAYDVSGAVVAYYLARALLESRAENACKDKYLDLIALSIVADVVPLGRENRYLLKKALPMLQVSPRPGLQSLFRTAFNFTGDIDEEFVGFQIAPRINAAGRVDTARKAVDLLTASDKAGADSLARELNSMNTIRKEIEAQILKEAEEQVSDNAGRRSIIALYGSSWHHGVLGIAAGKICEKYNKPTILLALKEDGKTVTGSARAPEGISIYNILKECNPQIVNFGGHSAAAGLNLELCNLDRFLREVERVAGTHHADRLKTVNIDMEFNLSDIDESLYSSIRKLAPFGEGFPKPAFISRGVSIAANLPIKDKGRRMVIADKSCRLPAVFWSDAGFDSNCDGVDIVYNLNRSSFRGETEIKLNILHIIQHESTRKAPAFALPRTAFSDLRHTENFEATFVPGKDDAVFYEGLESPFEKRVFNRFELVKSKHLIIYSAPPGVEVLKHIIKKSMPEKVTLVCKDTNPDAVGTIQKALGIIKYIVNRKNGRSSSAELACLLGMSLEAADVLLKYLYSCGLIGFQEDCGDLLLYRGDGRKLPDVRRYENILVGLLEEADYFRKYLKTIDVDKITELCLK